MMAIAASRNAIYDFFQSNAYCQQHFYAEANSEVYAAYYNSMYLLQDTAESVAAHRQKGFSPDPMQAYIEFWGIMQAVFIQQDSIAELWTAIIGKKLEPGARALSAWHDLRGFRNTCAGHPANRSHGAPPSRSFIGRGPMRYQAITYELYVEGADVSHPTVDLGAMLDRYDLEAARLLEEILAAMKVKYP